jgi:hypothetical protein
LTRRSRDHRFLGPRVSLHSPEDDISVCGLCGVFGVAEHWTDGSAGSYAEKQHRVSVGNEVLGTFGLRLAEWSGRYTLTGPTGGSAVVDNFGTLWPAAERLVGRELDPLDAKVIEGIEKRADRR